MKLTIAHSPCPNDTFMFYAMATGKLDRLEHDCSYHLHDVETLNQYAKDTVYDITKLSFAAYLRVRKRYRLLRCGAALGFGCGPILVGKRKLDLDRLTDARIAVPGELTTAHLLFNLFAPQAKRKLFVPYDRILSMLLDNQADCGVIIHESRFVFEQAGLIALQDLGAWWETMEGLPIPLGCIAAKSDIPDDVVSRIEDALRQSIAYGTSHHQEALAFAGRWAKELDSGVIAKHVKMFVNSFSLNLGEQGSRAVERLEQRAREAGFIS